MNVVCAKIMLYSGMYWSVVNMEDTGILNVSCSCKMAGWWSTFRFKTSDKINANIQQ